MGLANYIVELFGVRQFIADIDRDRQFWREGDTICHSVLDWAVNEGFDEFFSQHDVEFKEAHEFRQRHIIRALKSKGVV